MSLLEKLREYKPTASYRRHIELELPDLVFKRLLKMKADDGFGDKGWDVWLTDKSRGINLGYHEGEAIAENTKHLLEMWVQNFVKNVPFVMEKGKSIKELVTKEIEEKPDQSHGAGIVVGRGPNMFANKLIEMIPQHKFKGTIVATDGALIDLLKRKVVPDVVVSVDGSPIVEKWYNDPLVDEYGKYIKAILSCSVSPKVVERCAKAGIDTYFFIPMFDDYRSAMSFTTIEVGATKCEKFPDGLILVSCGGNAGTTSWLLAWNVLRLSPVALIGIEFGYRPEDRLEETYYWPKMFSVGDIDSTLERYEKVYNPEWDSWTIQDPIMKHYTFSFLDMTSQLPPWVRTEICSPGALFDPRVPKKFTCKPFKQFLEENSD